MNTRTKIEAGAAIAFLLCAGFGLRAERKARDAAQAVQKTQQAQIVDLQKQRDQLAAGDKVRETAVEARISALEKSAAAAQTPQQIAAYLTSVLSAAPEREAPAAAQRASQVPGKGSLGEELSGKGSAAAPALPQPIAISIPAPTAQSPTPSAIARIPEEDLAPLKNLAVQAQTCAAELPAAQQNLSSCQSQLKLAGEQLSAAQRESAAWKKAAKGTFWTRLKTRAKWLSIGVGFGAAALCGSGHCK